MWIEVNKAKILFIPLLVLIHRALCKIGMSSVMELLQKMSHLMLQLIPLRPK